MIAEPGAYAKAVELMADLRKHGIECGETVGGVGIYPDNEDQRAVAETVCLLKGVHYHDGDQSYMLDFREAMREEERGNTQGVP